MCSYNCVCIFYNYVCVFIIMYTNVYLCVSDYVHVQFCCSSMQVQDTQAVCLPGEAELQMGNNS